MKPSPVHAIVLLHISFSLAACNAYGQKPPGTPQKLTFARVESKSLTIKQAYACRITSLHHIEVRAVGDGYLEQISLREGQAVKKGDVLFKFIPVLHQARLDSELADLRIAQLEFNYTKKLSDKKTVSEDEIQLKTAKLDRAQAKVRLARAELDLVTIKAPFDGIVDRIARQMGCFVLKGEALTSLFDNSMMRAYFNVPEARYLEYMAGQGQHREDQLFELFLANGQKFPHPGKIGAIEAKFNEETGTLPFRADFPNPERMLRHRQRGTLINRRVLEDAVVIPQGATFEKSDKRWVYVVDDDNVAYQCEIAIQNETEGLFVVKKGVNVGDKIVMDGISSIRDGQKVEN